VNTKVIHSKRLIRSIFCGILIQYKAVFLDSIEDPAIYKRYEPPCELEQSESEDTGSKQLPYCRCTYDYPFSRRVRFHCIIKNQRQSRITKTRHRKVRVCSFYDKTHSAFVIPDLIGDPVIISFLLIGSRIKSGMTVSRHSDDRK